MKEKNKTIQESNNAFTKKELKDQTTFLTIYVVPGVLKNLEISLDQLEDENDSDFALMEIRMSEILFDILADKVKEDRGRMTVMDCYAVTTLVSCKIISLFDSFKKYSTRQIADAIAANIVEHDHLCSEDADGLYDFCNSLVEEVIRNYNYSINKSKENMATDNSSVESTLNAPTMSANDKIVKFDGKNVLLHDGEFIAWTYGGDKYDLGDPFATKKLAVENRNNNYGHLYKSTNEMNRLLPAFRYIFADSCGLEENVPVCSVEDRIIKDDNMYYICRVCNDFQHKWESLENENWHNLMTKKQKKELAASSNTIPEEMKNIDGCKFDEKMVKLYYIAKNHKNVDLLRVQSDNSFSCYIDSYNTFFYYMPETGEFSVLSVNEDKSEKVDEKDLTEWFNNFAVETSELYDEKANHHNGDVNSEVPKGPYIVLECCWCNGLPNYPNYVMCNDLKTAISTFEGMYHNVICDYDYLYKGTYGYAANFIKCASFEDDSLDGDRELFAVIALDELLEKIDKNKDIEHYDLSSLNADVDSFCEML